MLSMYISKLTLIVEEAQTIDVQKLCAFEKNYEVPFQLVNLFSHAMDNSIASLDELNFLCRIMLIVKKGNY